MEKDEIVITALENLSKKGSVSGKWQGQRKGDLDGLIDLCVNNQQYIIHTEVKRELRSYQLSQIQDLAKEYKNQFIVVAEKIFPKIKEELRRLEISYLEVNGNVFLKNNFFLIWIDTKAEPLFDKQKKTNRAFTKTGLKVVFYLLQNNSNIRKTYREISVETGVGLGNINYVFNGLKDAGHLVKLNNTAYKLINKKGLIEKWSNAYEDRLKPSIFIGSFSFFSSLDFNNWKRLKINTKHTVWGGEPAAELITNFLNPSELLIYTSESRSNLIKNYRLIPDLNGNIKVYKKFWNDDQYGKTSPPLLVYVDLMNSAKPRNIEVANKILNNDLQDLL
jgi:hypothetical protein